MRAFFSKLTWERLGVGSFLVFLLLTPLTYKIQLRAGLYQEGIYVEPLMPFLRLSILLFLWSFLQKKRKDFWTQARDFFIPHPIAKVFYLLLAVLFISWIYGVVLTGNFAWGDLLRLIKYGLYFLIFPFSIRAGKILGERRVYGILAVLFLVGVAASVVSLYRIYQFTAAGNVIDFWQYSTDSRSVGFLGQYLDLATFEVEEIPKAAHTTFGLYLSAILGVGLVFFSKVRRVVGRIGVLLGIGVILAALLFTLSRGAIITGSLVALAGVVWLFWQKRFGAVSVLAACLLLGALVLIQINPEIHRKFASTFLGGAETTEGVGGILDASLRGRTVMWGETWNLLTSKPQFFLLGVGYSISNISHFTDGKVIYPHSLFLDLWVRGGLLALVLGLVIWVLLFFKVIQLGFSKDKFGAAFGFGLFGFLTGWFLDNLISGEQFFSDAPMLAFWAVLGLVMALAQVSRKSFDSAQDRTKVLIALTSSQVGGAPKVVYDLLVNSKPLAVNGKFEFIVAAPPGPFVQKFKDLGYKVYPALLDRIGIKGFFQLFNIARKERVDLINSHGKGAGLYARKVGVVLGIPVVNTIHGIHYSKTNPLSRSSYFFSERILSLFTRLVINVSASQQKEGIKLRLFPKSKSRIVTNGVTLVKSVTSVKAVKNFRKNLGIGERDFVATMVARFDPPGVLHKGHGRFIELVPALIKAVPNLKVVFAGGGEGEGLAKRLVKELGIVDSVTFLGERKDIPKILAASDAFVLSSYHEGLPLVVLEASAAGLPVVGNKVVGIKDTVRNGQTGYLVDFGKAEEVAKALKRLAKNPGQRRRMGEQGRRFVEKRFSMEKFVRKTLAVYKEVLTDL